MGKNLRKSGWKGVNWGARSFQRWWQLGDGRLVRIRRMGRVSQHKRSRPVLPWGKVRTLCNGFEGKMTRDGAKKKGGMGNWVKK